MSSSRVSPEVARLERSIDSIQRLLEYLRSGSRHLTIESYLCLTGILSKAGWSTDGDRWRKKEQCLGLLEAAQVELPAQIVASKERILRQTVSNHRV